MITAIPATFQGVAAYQAGGKQPTTGPYKVRVLDVADSTASESGELGHKVTLQVIEAPWDQGQIGKSIILFLTPPQGKATAHGNRTAKQAEEDREGVCKQWLVGCGADPKKVDAVKGGAGWGAEKYYQIDPTTKQPDTNKPKEALLFYEAFPGTVEGEDEKGRSYKTFLTAQQYKAVVDKTMSIPLRNAVGASGQGGGGGGGGGGGKKAGNDPMAEIDGLAGGADPAQQGAKAPPAAPPPTVTVDDPLAGL